MHFAEYVWQRLTAASGGRRERRRGGRKSYRHGSSVRRLRWEGLESRELLAVNLVSTATNGFAGNAPSTNPQISEDGRYAVFESTANNLVANDLNSPNITDIFRRDLLTGQTVLVSINRVGNGGGNNNSFDPVISADGRFVAFASQANDLQIPDSNQSLTDIFIRDLVLNQTTVVSRNAMLNGTGSGISERPRISGDGRFVTFHSTAPDLVTVGLDTNGTTRDVFVWDRLNPNAMTLLSVPFNIGGSGNAASENPVISRDGQFVAFESLASNLVSNDNNGNARDVFVRAVAGGATALVSSGPNGSGTGSSATPTISDDGRWIAFTSTAFNLVGNDTNGFQDVFLRDRVNNVTTLLSIDQNGVFSGNGTSGNPVISGDGRVIAYVSTASNLTAGDVNGPFQDVYARDRTLNLTRLVSATPSGTSGSNSSSEPQVSLTGQFVTFSSQAFNLTTTDTNGTISDVFRRDLNAGTTILVSVAGAGSGNGASFLPRIDDTGLNIVFASQAYNMVTNDTNFNLTDVYHFTPTAPSSPQSIVTGQDQGGTSTVLVLDAGNFTQRRSIQPFGGFPGGARVATGDVNGDGVLDIIAAAGPGGGPHVRVFDGNTGAQLPGFIGSFYAYSGAFNGGVFVAAGDVNGDGRADVITGAGAGGGPHVRVFSGLNGAVLMNFYAYAPQFGGGVSVASGDVDGDGRVDVITGAGAGGGPHVRVFSGVSGTEIRTFYAYAPQFGGGVSVSAGDVNLDGRADIITGAGAGGGPHVRVFNGLNLAELYGFYALASTYSGGVRVGSVDANGDGRVDIIAGSGRQFATLRTFNGLNGSLLSEAAPFPGFGNGVFVAGTVAGVPGGSPLRADGGTNTAERRGELLQQSHLEAVAAAALARLTAAGVPAQAIDRLRELRWEVSELPADLLGRFDAAGIQLDLDAGGHGWYIDATPQDDVEFLSSDAAPAGIDLLSVVLHEFGHALHLNDLDPSLHAADVMASRLGPSQRRVAWATDAVFSQ